MNYGHLRYFWETCRSGGVTKAAARMRVSQSAVSVQLRLLESELGVQLFDRSQKKFSLTEAGSLTFEYCTRIFQIGDELAEVLGREGPRRAQVLRVGAVSTLSRNFLMGFLGVPGILDRTRVVIESGAFRILTAALKAHRLDVVLANTPAGTDSETPLHSHLLGAERVSIVGPHEERKRAFRFPGHLDRAPIVLPGAESEIRAAFDRIMELHRVHPRVVAEADDMATLRLLARDSGALALVPAVVVRDELAAGSLRELHRLADIEERLYAITPARRYPHPLVTEQIARAGRLPKNRVRRRRNMRNLDL